MKKNIVILALFFLIESCKHFHKKQQFIDSFINSEDYNEFFKNNYDEAYYYVDRNKEIKDYNRYFNNWLDDFKNGYFFDTKYRYYSQNKEKFYETTIISQKNINEIKTIVFTFKLNKNNKWVLWDIQIRSYR